MGCSLDAWFDRNCRRFGEPLDRIYANGDHTLNAKQQRSETWTAQIIEPIFRASMFEWAPYNNHSDELKAHRYEPDRNPPIATSSATTAPRYCQRGFAAHGTRHSRRSPSHVVEHRVSAALRHRTFCSRAGLNADNRRTPRVTHRAALP